jgi:hypothetical protein
LKEVKEEVSMFAKPVILLLLFLLNILFVAALWHMDVHHNLDRFGEALTRGVFKIKPEKAYRYSQYVLLCSLLLMDALFVFAVF